MTLGTRSSRSLSTKADMFSLGMVIHFMAFKGKLPYLSTGETLESLESLRQEVQSYAGYPPFPISPPPHPLIPNLKVRFSCDRYKQDDARKDLPDELHELLRLLLSRQPDQRPSCQEVLKLMNHPQRNFSQSRHVSHASWKRVNSRMRELPGLIQSRI